MDKAPLLLLVLGFMLSQFCNAQFSTCTSGVLEYSDISSVCNDGSTNPILGWTSNNPNFASLHKEFVLIKSGSCCTVPIIDINSTGAFSPASYTELTVGNRYCIEGVAYRLSEWQLFFDALLGNPNRCAIAQNHFGIDVCAELNAMGFYSGAYIQNLNQILNALGVLEVARTVNGLENFVYHQNKGDYLSFLPGGYVCLDFTSSRCWEISCPIGCGDPTCTFTEPQDEFHFACESGGEELYMWLESNGGASDSSCGSITWTNDFDYNNQNGYDPLCEFFYAEVTFTATESCGNVAHFERYFESIPPEPIEVPDELLEMHFEGCDDNDIQLIYVALEEAVYDLPFDDCTDIDPYFEVYSDGFYNGDPCVKVFDYYFSFNRNCFYDNDEHYGQAFLTDTRPLGIAQEASDYHTSCENQNDLQQSLDIFLFTNGGASAYDDCENSYWNDEITWSNDFTGIDLSQTISTHETVTFTATDFCGNSASTSATFYVHKCLEGPQFFSSSNPTPYGDFNNNEKLAFETEGRIEADNIIGSGTDITYDSGYKVILNEGFEVKSGATFEAKTDGCNPNLGPGGGCIADACVNEVCEANASGRLSDDGTECICACDEGYIDLGFGCVIECNGNNCSDGVCVDNECLCDTGSCGQFGTPVIANDGTTCNCLCDDGYTYNGNTCVENCDDFDCVNGDCYNNLCDCNLGYEGETCETLAVTKFLGTWSTSDIYSALEPGACQTHQANYSFDIVPNGTSILSAQIMNYLGLDADDDPFMPVLVGEMNGNNPNRIDVTMQASNSPFYNYQIAGVGYYSVQADGTEMVVFHFDLFKFNTAGNSYCPYSSKGVWIKN